MLSFTIHIGRPPRLEVSWVNIRTSRSPRIGDFLGLGVVMTGKSW